MVSSIRRPGNLMSHMLMGFSDETLKCNIQDCQESTVNRQCTDAYETISTFVVISQQFVSFV